MAKKKEVEPKATKKKEVKKKPEPIPPVLHKFKCLDCGTEFEDVGINNIASCSSCNSANTNRIG